jgi:hypothetical protein
MPEYKSRTTTTKIYQRRNLTLTLSVVVSVAGFFLFVLSGCAGPRHICTTVDDLNAQGEFSLARKYAKGHAEEYGDLNQLLYYLDTGTFAFSLGEYEEAIASFTEAERIMNELYTISLSREATTFLINDNTAPYRGEDFESVMVNLFLALSYANLSRIEDALVEARKVDSKLTAINLQYADDKKNAYKEDPFARLLMGILYEMGGTSADLNEAYISYTIALAGYEREYSRFDVAVPEVLLENILSLAQFMGNDELQKMRQRFPAHRVISEAERRENAEVYVLHFNGRTPVKEEGVVVFPIRGGGVVKIAFPRYREIPARIADSRVHAAPDVGYERFFADSRPAEPIGKIAVENLENRKVRIYAKTLARVTAKYLALREATRAARRSDEEHGGWAALLAQAAGTALIFASETADLRSWRTLPAEIRISKLTLPPGSYQLWAECVDASGRVVRKVELGSKELKAGGKILLQFRTTE